MIHAGDLIRYGVDWNKGVERCMGDEGVYRRVLSLFLEDDTFARASAAFERRDCEALFRCAHELKGVSGNASLPKLYDACYALVEALRGADAMTEGVESLFFDLETAFGYAREGVRRGLREA